ncbi:hypothetical protein EMPG_14835, partial [Blastomyces silverae]
LAPLFSIPGAKSSVMFKRVSRGGPGRSSFFIFSRFSQKTSFWRPEARTSARSMHLSHSEISRERGGRNKSDCHPQAGFGPFSQHCGFTSC